jgi:hypothetical protein
VVAHLVCSCFDLLQRQATNETLRSPVLRILNYGLKHVCWKRLRSKKAETRAVQSESRAVQRDRANSVS